MARAVWNGAVIAEFDATVEVEGNQYFPPDSIDRALLRGSGYAHHLSVEGHGQLLRRHRGRPD